MSAFFGSSLRTARSVLSDFTGSAFGFARFPDASQDPGRSPETTEMSSLRENGSSPGGSRRQDANRKEVQGTAGYGVEGGVEGRAPDRGKEEGGSAGCHGGEMEGDGKEPAAKISAWQAGWNVTNAIQGMFIVTFPYTVLQGGYWALLAMLIVAYVCCYTGKILVDCLYEDVPWSPGCAAVQGWERKRVRSSYVEIAEEVWGKRFGGRVVYVAQLIELMMTCILYILLCGMLMSQMFPSAPLDLTAWIMVHTVVLLPCAFLRSLRHVAWLSFWCTVAHMFINAIILVYCFTLVADWDFRAVQVKVDIWTFPISLGIVVFSYTSQIFLPSLEGRLVDRGQFATMMHWTHVAAALFKASFAYIGFVTFGTDTKEVITNNLPNHTMKVVVNFFLIAKALLSYPLPYFATAELLETTFFLGKPTTACPSCYDDSDSLKPWSLTLRLALILVTMLMAMFIPHFALLMGLIGSFTGYMLSLVWPAYFHLAIKGRFMGWPQKAINMSILLMGLVCSGLGIYYSTHALVRAFQGIESRPFQTHY